jgi:hypothetical protein
MSLAIREEFARKQKVCVRAELSIYVLMLE